jgi:hypothetical protein
MGIQRLVRFTYIVLFMNAALWGLWLQLETFSQIGEHAGWIAAVSAAEGMCFLSVWIVVRGFGWVQLGFIHDRFRKLALRTSRYSPGDCSAMP